MFADDTLDPPIISDPEQLARLGVLKVPIPDKLDAAQWAYELSQVSPEVMAAQGDTEYSFYRSFLEDPDFPFEFVLGENSEIGKSILRHFNVTKLDEVRLDDAFCVHYNMEQEDSSGAKHMDPSDITVNMCLEKTEDVEGSEVVFYGTKTLENVGRTEDDDKDASYSFLVQQEAGYATMHWGDHPHKTMALQKGKRTNIVFTYCYKDSSRSDVSSRTCYFTQ
jgi:hypothetical protein